MKLFLKKCVFRENLCDTSVLCFKQCLKRAFTLRNLLWAPKITLFWTLLFERFPRNSMRGSPDQDCPKRQFETPDPPPKSFSEIHAFLYIIFPPAKNVGGPKINIFGKSKRYLEIPKFPEVPRVWNQYNSSMKLFSTTKSEKNMRLEIQLLDSGNLGELSGNLAHLSWVCTEVPKHHISESTVTFATEKQRIFTILMSDFTKTGCWPAKWVDHDDS